MWWPTTNPVFFQSKIKFTVANIWTLIFGFLGDHTTFYDLETNSNRIKKYLNDLLLVILFGREPGVISAKICMNINIAMALPNILPSTNRTLLHKSVNSKSVIF